MVTCIYHRVVTYATLAAGNFRPAEERGPDRKPVAICSSGKAGGYLLVEPVSNDDTPTQRRDRSATEANLIAAARKLLADFGFRQFGVNAVARLAGCDKQLVYRYFGGLGGLVDALGLEIAEGMRRKLAPLADPPPPDYRTFAERMILGFLEMLRGDPLLRQIMAWEIAGPSELVSRLTFARSRAMSKWVAESRGGLSQPPDMDVTASNAALLAAVQHLVLSASASGEFAGLPLRTEEDWERVRATVKSMIDAVYGRERTK